MGYLFTAEQFCYELKKIANYNNTLYVMGCFGAPMTQKNKTRYKKNNVFNTSPTRQKMIDGATEKTYGFDCVGLVKSVLWGFNFCDGKNDGSRTYGGATYKANGVPDTDAKKMLNYCSDVSSDFATIVDGEFVWMDGHCGVCVDAGKGLVVECTPKWTNNVQYSYISNLGIKVGNTRKWEKHGKLQWIDYTNAKGISKVNTESTTTAPTTNKTATVKIESAKSCNTSYSRTYTTTTQLNLRAGAGINKTLILAMPKGLTVRCYGYYTQVNNVKWFLVQTTYRNKVYTGFCHSSYLR